MYLSGHEKAGFYDIITGRPRYPFMLYNDIRTKRVQARENAFSQQRPFKLTTPLPNPEGLPHTVPNLKNIIKQAQLGNFDAFEKLSGPNKLIKLFVIAAMISATVIFKAKTVKYDLLDSTMKANKVQEEEMPLVVRLIMKADRYIIPYTAATIAPIALQLLVGREIPLIGYGPIIYSLYILYQIGPDLMEAMQGQDDPAFSMSSMMGSNFVGFQS